MHPILPQETFDNTWKFLYCPNWASLVAQRVKNLPVMCETEVQSLGWEDPLQRKWKPTPVFLPGKFHGQKSLMGYSQWVCKESDITEHTQTLFKNCSWLKSTFCFHFLEEQHTTLAFHSMPQCTWCIL